MKLLKGVGDFFALDIGTNAVRVVQLGIAGQNSWVLKGYGYAPVDSKITSSDSKEGNRQLGEVIMTAVGQSGIHTRDVAIGLTSQKTFTAVVDVPTMSEAELKSTMKYQLDQYIPMPIEDAKIDWKLIGASVNDATKLEVLVTSTAKNYAEAQLELVESLGFNVIAEEPDPIAMIRSLLPANTQDARLIVDMGEQYTDIALTLGESPRLVRTIPIGLNTLIKASVQNLNIKDEQAKQFILKFGLAPDRLEGQVLRSIENVLDNFANELMKSIKFFQTRYPNVQVAGVLGSGFVVAIPRFSEYISSRVGIPVEGANPWQKVNVGQFEQQIAPVRNEFATVVGLAQRSNR
jgi:type IV pilus assembly protein PilM